MTVAMPVAVLVRVALGRHAQLQRDASVRAAVRREERRDTGKNAAELSGFDCGAFL